jgi:hypothetical protein
MSAPNSPLSYYMGTYSIETYHWNIGHREVPAGAMVEGNVIRVESGSVQSISDTLLFHAQGKSFALPMYVVKCIRNDNNDLLWQNPLEQA